MAEPDGLLLDEPTNHLDALATEWLQGFLQRFKGALVLITHDRYFLERVTDTSLSWMAANCAATQATTAPT